MGEQEEKSKPRTQADLTGGPPGPPKKTALDMSGGGEDDHGKKKSIIQFINEALEKVLKDKK